VQQEMLDGDARAVLGTVQESYPDERRGGVVAVTWLAPTSQRMPPAGWLSIEVPHVG
jgi:hypothetical protein